MPRRMAPGASKTGYFLLAFVALPQALAGPGCARRNYGKPDCVERCKSGWGVAGHYMGSNRWGSVISNSNNDTGLDGIIAVACGLSQSGTPDPGSSPTDLPPTPSSSPPPANGYEPTPSVSTSGEPSYPAPSSPSSSPASPNTSPTPKFTPIPYHSGSPPSSPPPSSSPPSPPPATPPSLTSSSGSPPPSPTSTPGNVASPTPSSSPSPSPSPSPSTNTSSSSPSLQNVSSLEADALKGHNDFRALHGASPLSWSDDLATAAQKWVSKCVFQHSDGQVGQYGENLAAGTGSGYTVTNAINDWDSEASQYDPNNPQYSHFTQVVWKSTTQLGCAVVTCPAGSIFDASWGSAQFIACEYNPPGNVIGEFAENVQA